MFCPEVSEDGDDDAVLLFVKLPKGMDGDQDIGTS